MRLASVLRWTAVALAAIAIVDPRLPLPRRSRPAVRLVAGPDGGAADALRRALEAKGFRLAGESDAAAVATRDAAIDQVPDVPLFAVAGATPNVAVRRALVGGFRVPGQSVAVAVTLHAAAAAGRTTELRLEDGGLTVATASHRWSADEESWQPTLSYLPGDTSALRLRVRAVTAGDRDASDDVADVLAPAERGPIRTLVFAPVVSWPAVFVRRALEDDPAFSVASLQRVTKSAAVRAGAPPAVLTRADLEPFEVLLCGSMDLDASSRDAVRWFVERRGGVAVFVPDRTPAPTPLLAGVSFEPRVLDKAVVLQGASVQLTASELALPRGLPPLTASIASDAAGTPVVFTARRGRGAVIVSGALDAWRYRDAPGFARFWPAAIVSQAIATPPRLEVAVAPAVVRPGDVVRIAATMRETEIPDGADELALPPASARAVAPAARVDVAVRLWPSAAPGRYEGEWRPGTPGEYAIEVSVGSLTAAAIVSVDAAAAGAPDLAARSAIAARASGGAVYAGEAALATALASRFPPRMTNAPARPARSVWWAVAFTGLLCGEWALRRRRGLA